MEVGLIVSQKNLWSKKFWKWKFSDSFFIKSYYFDCVLTCPYKFKLFCYMPDLGSLLESILSSVWMSKIKCRCLDRRELGNIPLDWMALSKERTDLRLLYIWYLQRAKILYIGWYFLLISESLYLLQVIFNCHSESNHSI